MFALRPVCASAVLASILLCPAFASDDPAPAIHEILEVRDHADRAVPVPPWDPASPQKLVRIDGRLFQQHDDRFWPVVADRITVRLADGVESWDDLVALATGDALGTFESLSLLTPVRANSLRIVDLAVPEGTNVATWCELAHRTGLVRYAEVATYGEYLATQTDPRYPEQWGLNNTGQTGGTPGTDIDAERAWDMTAGSPSLIVAILDSGTDVDHEDLAANVWHNDGEIPDNGVDDDGNGYVDDWEGWDFDRNDNDPRSTNTHGTHVTGVVNAAGSNGIGIAGVAGGLGGPGVRGMALGIGDLAPNAGALDDAIVYAADNGARVITISSALSETQAINDALDYAYNVRDVFIDCATGNDQSAVRYPATRPEAMAVAASDHNDQRPYFSNYGPDVEVSAPGANILSTRIGDSYGTEDGTSFAAPHVAGVAALVRSRNPGLRAPEVRQLIIDTAEDIGDPGFDVWTGHGRINAFQAVAAAASSDGRISLDATAYACGNTVFVTVTDIDLAGAGNISVPVSSETEVDGESVTLSELGTGSGVFRGSIGTATGPAGTDGVLQVGHGDTITAEYLDADDGSGGTDVLKSATAAVDCVAPAISGVGTQNLSNTSVSVVWSTDEPATSLVRYGETAPPSQEVGSGVRSTSHAVNLSGLAECTTYLYEVESADAVGNGTVDDNGGAYHTLRTHGDFPGLGIVPCTRGQIWLDAATYACNGSAGIAVIDVDLDTDPGVVETANVLVTSTSEPAGEWIVVTEIGPSNSRFEGTIPLDGGPAAPGDGILAVAAGDLITASYHDEDDGEGNSRIVYATSNADCTAPSISGIRVMEITSTRAVVEWTTDEPATSRVDFGPTPALGGAAESPALATAHSVAISPFDACDRVYFRVSGADAHGDVGVADAGGEPLSFNTSQIGGLVYFEDFETDTGWQLPGDWERGTPQGLGTNGGDPVGAWSGSGAIGNDLSGQGTFPGDYEPSTTTSAISPVFSTRQERNLELIMRRKLGVTSADEAGVYVITSGADQVWTSNYNVHDSDWVVYSTSISAWADNKSSVQLEFRMEGLGAEHSFGWNVDEIIVKDSTQPDYALCGGCAGPPAFTGVTSVVDPDPCAPGGLLVQWQPAGAWGTGSSGTYDVHRGATPDFVPDSGNRVVSGLTGTSWTDAAAPVGTPVWYIVRARNDESCTGGEGLADGNLVRLGATETTNRPIPDPVGATVVAGGVGSAHVRLEWAPAAGAASYRIRRGESYDFTDAVEIGSTTGTFFEDAGAAADTVSYSYRVFAVDACGREE